MIPPWRSLRPYDPCLFSPCHQVPARFRISAALLVLIVLSALGAVLGGHLGFAGGGVTRSPFIIASTPVPAGHALHRQESGVFPSVLSAGRRGEHVPTRGPHEQSAAGNDIGGDAQVPPPSARHAPWLSGGFEAARVVIRAPRGPPGALRSAS